MPSDTPSLHDSWQKLNWAKRHFELLRPEVEAFEQRQGYRIRCDVDAGTGEYRFHIFDIEPIPSEWALMIGDCLFNARCSLDYVVVNLMALVTGRKPDEVKVPIFPIHESIKGFAGALAAKDTGFEDLKKLEFKGFLTRIEELQPFNNGNPSIWGWSPELGAVMSRLPVALSRLSALHNIDKHRVIHTVGLGGEIRGGTNPETPPGFQFLGAGRSIAPLKENAQVGTWNFAVPLPSDWHPSEVEMKRYFPLKVAIEDPNAMVNTVSEVIPLLLWGVETVLNIFEPVFHGKPPLSVTVSLPPNGTP